MAREKYILPIGTKFNSLTVISMPIIRNRARFYNCLCDCGKEKLIAACALKNGNSKTCGAGVHKSNYRDGLGENSLAKLHTYMMYRCYNTKSKDYLNYGGRGIVVCDRWHDRKNFVFDLKEQPFGLQLDRIDNNKGYYLENVRWSTPSQNARNKNISLYVTYNGETKHIKEWCELLNIKYMTMRARLRTGASVETCFKLPVINGKGRIAKMLIKG